MILAHLSMNSQTNQRLMLFRKQKTRKTESTRNTKK